MQRSAIRCCCRLLSRMLRRFDMREAAIRCDDEDLPHVSVVLPMLGDDRHALDRVQNLLAAEFPVDRMEVVVGCAAPDELVNDLISTLNDPPRPLGRMHVVAESGETD